MKAFLIFAAFAAATPALAAEKAPADSADGADAAKKERKICKREPTSTGLYASRRICMTSAEWRRRAKADEIQDARLRAEQ